MTLRTGRIAVLRMGVSLGNGSGVKRLFGARVRSANFEEFGCREEPGVPGLLDKTILHQTDGDLFGQQFREIHYGPAALLAS